MPEPATEPPEQPVSSRVAFQGRLIRVRVDQVRTPDGQEHTREVAEHPGAVAILPVLPSGQLVLVRQYRHAVGRTLLEVPAGTREPGESPLATAQRELFEETGYQAARFEELARFYVSPGWANEELIVYRAVGLRAGAARPADDERIDVVIVDPEALPRLVRQREIADAKTLVALGVHFGGIPRLNGAGS